MKGLRLAANVPFVEHSRIWGRSRRGFSTELKGFGSVPCFPEMCGQLNSLKMRESANISTGLVSSGWLDIFVATLILLETWGPAETEFSSSSRTFGLVTPGELPAQDFKWNSKTKSPYTEKCRKAPYPNNFWC